ncbi:hypothetical protein GXP67_30070 [Rhodocytophaga rosea]|uniref:Uncharacterized protein n=1 Tax=Rhodocytophaga rosea TaxID=2704465 RepID=A0A6C0GRA7_9BACT|nr:hypothetical protein [Rhodocytophaga rosea]QHT70599.1 hypothetical protein GXP67_30070 [Rhodocytophaga rosea]
MYAEELISDWNVNRQFSDKQLSSIFENSILKIEVIDYLKVNPNREFAQNFLERVLSKRREGSDIGTGDNIMFASYLLGLHGNVEDSLLIWRAKNVDFDAFCYVDIQLVVFAGVEETIGFFILLNTEESTKAAEYLKQCKDAGNFGDINEYYSAEQLPWWI